MNIKKITLDEKIGIVKRKTKKTQIMIYDTGRKVNNFINRIKYRLVTNYNDVPHFIITKEGEIFQLFDTKYYSKMFYNDIDKKQIKISLENLGKITKDSVNNLKFNWVGDKTFDEPLLKRWRNGMFWDKYTEPQVQSLINLTRFLLETENIKNECVPSNSVSTKVNTFNGIVYKSNFSDIYTDINPSFFNFKFDERLQHN